MTKWLTAMALVLPSGGWLVRHAFLQIGPAEIGPAARMGQGFSAFLGRNLYPEALVPLWIAGPSTCCLGHRQLILPAVLVGLVLESLQVAWARE